MTIDYHLNGQLMSQMSYATWYNGIYIESTHLLFCFDAWALTLFALTPWRCLHFRKYGLLHSLCKQKCYLNRTIIISTCAMSYLCFPVYFTIWSREPAINAIKYTLVMFSLNLNGIFVLTMLEKSYFLKWDSPPNGVYGCSVNLASSPWKSTCCCFIVCSVYNNIQDRGAYTVIIYIIVSWHILFYLEELQQPSSEICNLSSSGDVQASVKSIGKCKNKIPI